jgi:hypothetical protein
MNHLTVPFVLSAALSLTGCLTVPPLVSIVTAGAGYLFDMEKEKAVDSISVNELLVQAGGSRKVLDPPKKELLLSLSVTGDQLDEVQRQKVSDFADELVANDIVVVEVFSGSAGNDSGWVAAFASIQRGRKVAKALQQMGVSARVKIDPILTADQIEIVPTHSVGLEDA